MGPGDIAECKEPEHGFGDEERPEKPTKHDDEADDVHDATKVTVAASLATPFLASAVCPATLMSEYGRAVNHTASRAWRRDVRDQFNRRSSCRAAGVDESCPGPAETSMPLPGRYRSSRVVACRPCRGRAIRHFESGRPLTVLICGQ